MKIKVERIECAIPPIPIGNAGLRLIGNGRHLDMGGVPLDQAYMIFSLQHPDKFNEAKSKAEELGDKRLVMEELLKLLLPEGCIKEVYVNNLTERGYFEADITIKYKNSNYTTVKVIPSNAIALGLIVGAEIYMESELCRSLNHTPVV